jgi:hypothetical protein
MVVRDMWIYGGMDGMKKYSDLWRWNEEGGWNEIKFTSKGPGVVLFESFYSFSPDLVMLHSATVATFSFFLVPQVHSVRKTIYGHLIVKKNPGFWWKEGSR